jgi:hypothetical protein
MAESWRVVLREGFFPHLPTAGLEALRGAVERDDPRLTQGSTTTPPPLMGVQDWPCEAACLIGWCGWKGGTDPACETVGDVEEFFARACFDADQALGEAAACRWLLNWFDDAPRNEVLRELGFELGLELDRRRALEAAPAVPYTAGAGQELPEVFS